MEYVDFQRYEERRRVCREGGGVGGLSTLHEGNVPKLVVHGRWGGGVRGTAVCVVLLEVKCCLIMDIFLVA